jgi:hypothetical protein
MVPLSPTACVLVTTALLIVTLYAGEWLKIKMMISFMEKEVWKNKLWS